MLTTTADPAMALYITDFMRERMFNFDIPANVWDWYQELTSACASGKFKLQPLVQFDGQYGIFATCDIIHPDVDDWEEEDRTSFSEEWISATQDRILDHLNTQCQRIAEVIPYQIIVGQNTGLAGRHEIVVWFPFGTTLDDYRTALGIASDASFTF